MTDIWYCDYCSYWNVDDCARCRRCGVRRDGPIDEREMYRDDTIFDRLRAFLGLDETPSWLYKSQVGETPDEDPRSGHDE